MSKVIFFSMLVLAGAVLVWTLPLENNLQAEETQENSKKSDCFLRKILPDGKEIRINKSRAEVGTDEYADFIELCGDDGEQRLSILTLKTMTG